MSTQESAKVEATWKHTSYSSLIMTSSDIGTWTQYWLTDSLKCLLYLHGWHLICTDSNHWGPARHFSPHVNFPIVRLAQGNLPCGCWVSIRGHVFIVLGNRKQALTLGCLLGLLLNWPKLNNNNNNMASVNEREFSTELPSGFKHIIKYPRSLFATLCIQTAQLGLLNLAVHLNLIIFILYEAILFITSFCPHISRWRNSMKNTHKCRDPLPHVPVLSFLGYRHARPINYTYDCGPIWPYLLVISHSLCFFSYILWCSRKA